MITISKKVEYSLVFILYLLENGDKNISLMAASKHLSLPYRFLGQIAGSLKTAGILSSKEGKSGGYVMTPGWEKRSIYDVLDALGEVKTIVKCGNCHRDGKCQIKKVFDKIESGFLEELRKLKLNEITL